MGLMPAPTPFRAMLQDPVRQGMLKTDVPSRLLGLDPFVPEDLFPLGLKFAVERGVLYQVVATGHSMMARCKVTAGFPSESSTRYHALSS